MLTTNITSTTSQRSGFAKSLCTSVSFAVRSALASLRRCYYQLLLVESIATRAGHWKNITTIEANSHRKIDCDSHSSIHASHRSDRFVRAQMHNGETYIWLYNASTVEQTRREIGIAASDPANPLTWNDAAEIMRAMREMEWALAAQAEANADLDADGNWR